jgi:hypothetical protein
MSRDSVDEMQFSKKPLLSISLFGARASPVPAAFFINAHIVDKTDASSHLPFAAFQ